MLSLAAATALLVQGCAFMPKSDPDRPAYQAGRYAAFFYTLTKPALPEKVRLAVDNGYGVLSIVLANGTVPLDAAVSSRIDEMYADASPEFRAMIFNFYKMAVQRLQAEMELAPHIPSIEIVDNFMAGVADSLKDWGGIDAPPVPANLLLDVVTE